MIRSIAWIGVFVAASALGGCKKEADSSADSGTTGGRQIGQFSDSTRGATQPAVTTTAPAAASMPNDPIHAGLGGQDVIPVFAAPLDWQPKPTRPMVEQVFAIPKAEGDAEDGELTVSQLAGHVPLDANVLRWCGQFGIQGKPACDEAAKRTKLEGAKFPTTLVEIAGTYRPSSGPMMQSTGETKPNYKMLAAELVAPQSRWFVKMIGPEKTVEHWREAFMKYVAEAK